VGSESGKGWHQSKSGKKEERTKEKEDMRHTNGKDRMRDDSIFCSVAHLMIGSAGTGFLYHDASRNHSDVRVQMVGTVSSCG
jgi:hypothetical protein